MGIARLLLAAVVVTGHAEIFSGPRIISGSIAVECFFVISGFYMALVLDRKYGRLPSKIWSTFISARLLRLYPTYAVILLGSLTLALVQLRQGDDGFFEQISRVSPATALTLAASNITMIGQDILMFVGVNPTGDMYWTTDFSSQAHPAWLILLIPPAWSISAELLFYLLVPWAARRSTTVLVSLFIGSLFIRLTLFGFGLTNDPWSYRFFPSEIMFFIFGMLAYRLGYNYYAKRTSLVRIVTYICIAIMGVVTFSHAGPAVATLAPLGFAIIVPLLFQLSRSNKIDRWIGDLSYPVYISHWLIRGILLQAGIPVSGPLLLVSSIGVSILLQIAVEQPIERVRARRIAERLQPELSHAVPELIDLTPDRPIVQALVAEGSLKQEDLSGRLHEKGTS